MSCSNKSSIADDTVTLITQNVKQCGQRVKPARLHIAATCNLCTSFIQTLNQISLKTMIYASSDYDGYICVTIGYLIFIALWAKPLINNATIGSKKNAAEAA
jgi:hypothetical protein